MQSMVPLFRIKMYKPPEEQITKLENQNFREWDYDDLLHAMDEIAIMLQTPSYQHHYIDRILKIEDTINAEIVRRHEE